MADRPPYVPRTGAGFPSGLSLADYADIAQAVRDFPGTWTVERDVNDRGQTSISAIQESVSDEEAVVFLVWCERGRYCVGLGQDDFYANLGSHDGVEGAIMAMRSAIRGSTEMKDWMDQLHFPRAAAK